MQVAYTPRSASRFRSSMLRRGSARRKTGSTSAGPIVERFLDVQSIFGKRIACVIQGSPDRAVSYQGISLRAAAIASYVRDNTRCARIGLLFSEANADEMLASYLGCLAARRSVVLLDPNWRPTELRRVVDQSLLEVILSDPEFKDAKSQELATASAGDLHALASMILSVPNGDEIKSNHHGKGLAQFLAVPHADETEGRVYLTTSGTTGEPKIVEHSQAGVVATVDAIGSAFSSNLGFSRAEMQSLVRLITSHPKALIRAAVGQRVWLTSLALWRVAGHSLMMQAILTRGTLVVPTQSRSFELVQLARKWRANIIALSPIAGELFVRAAERNGGRMPHLIVLGFGSDRVRNELLIRAKSVLGCAVVVGYGSTELGGGISNTSFLDPVSPTEGYVGRLLPGVRVRVVDGSQLEVGSGELGRIQCQIEDGRIGRMVRSQKVDDLEVSSVSAEWHDTGDAGWMSSDGRLYVTGRTDDLIIRGGNNIDPVEVEQVLEECAFVDAAALVGIEKRLGVPRLIAVLQMNGGGPDCFIQLTSLLYERLTDYKIPDLFVVVDALPTSGDGKVSRAAIRSAIWHIVVEPRNADAPRPGASIESVVVLGVRSVKQDCL